MTNKQINKVLNNSKITRQEPKDGKTFLASSKEELVMVFEEVLDEKGRFASIKLLNIN